MRQARHLGLVTIPVGSSSLGARVTTPPALSQTLVLPAGLATEQARQCGLQAYPPATSSAVRGVTSERSLFLRIERRAVPVNTILAHQGQIAAGSTSLTTAKVQLPYQFLGPSTSLVPSRQASATTTNMRLLR